MGSWLRHELTPKVSGCGGALGVLKVSTGAVNWITEEIAEAGRRRYQTEGRKSVGRL